MASRNILEIRSPVDGSVVGAVQVASELDIGQAVATALVAQRAWSALTAEARSEILWRFGDLVERNATALAELDTQCTGKVLRDALAEVRRGARHARYWAGMADKLYGQQLADVPGRLSYTVRAPLGVYAVILPWNAPAHSFMARSMPPLACGNAVIVKPSELSPLSAIELAKLAEAAGMPAGVVQVMVGAGATGAALASHPEVRGVSFTGSPQTGRRILAAAAETFKKVTLELGGKSPIIVFPDADLDSAARAVVMGIVANAGQICAASSRLLVHCDIADAFMASLRRRIARVVVGDPRDERTQIGPVVCQRQYERVLDLIQRGINEGAQLLSGGGRPAALAHSPGLYVEPTILDAGERDMTVTKEEIFGPVLTVSRFASEAQAIHLANDTEYGLAAYVWSGDAGRLLRVTDALEAGVVHGNTTLVMDSGLPFGGFKNSGLGGAFGGDAIDGCTQTKRITIRMAEGPLPVQWDGV